MNVLLLRPPYARPSYLANFTLTEALTEIFLAPALRPRHRVRVIDLRVTPDLHRELGDFQPDAVVLPMMPLSQGVRGRVLGRLKLSFPDVKVLVVGAAEYGAAHVVERPEDYLHPLADALIPAFYLRVLLRLVPQVLDAWDGRRHLGHIPGVTYRVDDDTWLSTEPVAHEVGDIGVPDRTLLGRARGHGKLGGIGNMAYVMYTDGCRYGCRYCSMSKAGPGLFTRSLPDVLEELHGVTEPNVFLADYEPLGAPEAMLRLADSLEAEGIRKNWYLLARADTALDQAHVLERWREVGLRWIFIGIDGHSTARLQQVGKGTSMAVNEAAVELARRWDLGLSVNITVPPDASREDFAAIRHTARTLGAPMIGFTVETPLVGTRLFDENEHRLTTRDWSLYDMEHAVLPTTLPLGEFYKEMTRLQMLSWRLSSRGVLRHHPWRDLLRNARSGPGALWRSWTAARDHGAPVAPLGTAA